MKKSIFNNVINFSVILLLVLATSCSKDDSERKDFASVYGGKTFKGAAKGEVFENGSRIYTWNGDGTVAVIEAKGDSVSIVFLADFGKEGEMNFKVRGKYDKMNYFLGERETSYFSVDGKNIAGKISNADQNLTFTGVMENEKVNMTMTVEFLKNTSSFKKGEILNLNFDTSRNLSEGNNTEGCQMKMVPVWSPNGMTMGMVLDC